MADNDKSTKPGPSASKKTGPLFKLLGAAGKLAKSVGLMTPAESSFLSGMHQYDDVFLGKDPWLTGNVPLTPKQPPGEPPRKFQFTPGYNIAIQPRSTEQVSFAQLRSLGEYTIIRIIIEHIKNSLKAHEWDIVPQETDSGVDYSADIAVCKEFWEKPDKRHSWHEWLGMVLEEILVLDALAIYKHRSRNGKLWALEVIDGSTIKALCDTRGFEPISSTVRPIPAYQQFLYGVPYANMTREELIYRPMTRRANKFYGYPPTEQTAVTINQGMRRELMQLAQFTDGNIPTGVGSVPKDWTPEEIRQWQEYWDSLLAGDIQNRSRIKFVPEGFNLTKFKEDELYNTKNSFDEWMARVFCFACGISPIPFISMTNRSVAEELGDSEAEGGVAVLKQFIEKMVNEIIDHELAMPWLNFNWITDRGRLQMKRVERNVEYIKVGVLTLDEVREEEGMKPLDIPPGIMTGGGYQVFPTRESLAREEAQRQQMQQQMAAQMQQPPVASGAPAEPPAQEKAPPPAFTQKAMLKARLAELGEWERWALARLREGKLSKSSFETEFIGDEEADLIRKAVTPMSIPEEIKRLFAAHRGTPPPVRLQPPTKGDMAHMAGDLRSRLRAALEAEVERSV
jgi:hypothetical protein